MRHRSFRPAACLALVLLLAACAAPGPELIVSQKSAVELRAMQSRAFETPDQAKVYRAVLATLQDLGYTIEKVEPAAGTVTADKFAMLTLTATVYPRGETRTIVRSNAVVKPALQQPQIYQVDAPAFYQQRFFEPLEKALFLTALQIEDGDEVVPPRPVAAEEAAATVETPVLAE